MPTSSETKKYSNSCTKLSPFPLSMASTFHAELRKIKSGVTLGCPLWQICLTIMLAGLSIDCFAQVIYNLT